jgi:hypothetical protein
MRSCYILLTYLLISLLHFLPVKAQERHRIMFYNVENLFDPFKDSLTNDDEFTPQGTRFWTWKRMTEKLNNITKVITAVGEWDPPVLVGFCEVENRFVMTQLITKTPLAKFNYQLVHRESPDRRGIDVALIYRPDRFVLEEERFFQLINPDEPHRTTREVLYARGIIAQLDTLHVFVNHWPSKYGGELASEPGRLAAGRLVREKIDSIRIFHPNARIIVMGDFNDGPNSNAIVEALGAKTVGNNIEPSEMYNLHHKYDGSGAGTLKYQGQWETIDMMIVSGALLNRLHGVYANPEGGMIFKADFLLEEDTSFVGVRPFRTYIGFKYHGGYSDHLPIYLDLYPNR